MATYTFWAEDALYRAAGRHVATETGWADCLGGNGTHRGGLTTTTIYSKLFAAQYQNRRLFLHFNTASLAGLSFASAKLELNNKYRQQGDEGYMDLYLTKGVQSTPDVVISDYQNQLPYSGKGGTHPYLGDGTEDFIVEINFNGLALGWINGTGITKLCIRTAGDLDSLAAPVSSNQIDFATDNGTPHTVEKLPRLTVITSDSPVIASVSTKPATEVGTQSAVLNGYLDYDGGEACDCGFEWGETVAYGNTTTTQSKTTGQSFSKEITGLAGYIYHFRAFATNTAGTAYGEDETFTTEASGQDLVDETVIGNKVSLEAIRNLETAYGGRAYINKSGNFVYESRYHRNV